jgi:hypothetical protein
LGGHEKEGPVVKGEIEKSTRHSKIAGDFGEAVLLYWLSRSGFECARVDHTGIDLIARRPDSSQVLGISVKSHTRLPGRESATLNIERTAITKASTACDRILGVLSRFHHRDRALESRLSWDSSSRLGDIVRFAIVLGIILPWIETRRVTDR